MASLDLPVETRMASFSRLAGMSLAAGVTRFAIPVGVAVSGVDSSSCTTSFKAACSSYVWAMVYMCFQFSIILFISGSRVSSSRITPAMVSGMVVKRKG